MATTFTIMLPLSLLIFVATHVCYGSTMGRFQEISSLNIQLHYDEKVPRSQHSDMKTQLGDRENRLPRSQQYSDMDTQLGYQDNKMEEFFSRHSMCELRVQELELQVKNLENMVETQKPVSWKQMCEHQQHLDTVKKAVREYINNKDWEALRRDVNTVLDESSEIYTQLEQSKSLFDVGYYGSTELAALLLCAGLPVDTKDSDRDNMLQGAAYGAKLQTMKLLLDYDVNVNVVGRFGNTPLMRAADNGFLQGVQLLVQAGARISTENNYGSDAMYYAKLHDRTAVVRYLNQLSR